MELLVRQAAISKHRNFPRVAIALSRNERPKGHRQLKVEIGGNAIPVKPWVGLRYRRSTLRNGQACATGKDHVMAWPFLFPRAKEQWTGPHLHLQSILFNHYWDSGEIPVIDVDAEGRL
jgi:hypothetical protein